MTQPARRSHMWLILVLWGAGLAAAAQFAKISFAFDELEAIYPGWGAGFGLILSLISLVGVVLGAFAGPIVQRIGYRRVLIGALVLGAVLSLYQALLPSFPLFLLSRALEGLSHLAIVVAAPTLIAQLAPQPYQAAALALWGSFFGVAYALTGWFGAPLVAAAGPAPLFIAHAVGITVILGLLMVLLPREAARAQSPERRGLDLSGLVESYRSPNLSAAGLGWFFYTLTFVAMLTLLPRIAPGDTGGMLATNLPLVSIASGLTIAVLLLRFVPAVWLLTAAFAAAGVLLFIAVVTAQALWPYWLLGLLWGLIQSAGFSTVAQLNTTQADRARANGLMAQMGNLGNLVGTPLLSAILIAGGTVAGLAAIALCFAVAVLVQLWLAWRRAGTGVTSP